MEETNSLVKLIKEKRLADFKQQLDEVYDYVARTEEAADKALATVREWNKDSEIQKLQEEILSLKSKLYNDYTLTSDEYKEVKKWQTDHVTKDHRGKHSGYWSYKFTPTEIGTVGVYICEHCHKEFMFREP